MYLCVACGKKREEKIVSCSCGVKQCLKLNYLNKEKEKKDKKIITVKDILNMNFNFKPIEGFEFLGGVPDSFTMLTYGIMGSGKSTFCLQLADKLQRTRGKTIYFAIEEGNESATIQVKLKNCNITPDLIIDYVQNANEIIARIQELKCRNVFIDSVTHIKLSTKDIAKIRDETKGILCLIAHSTKEQEYKGDSSLGHFVDLIVKASSGIARTKWKNRFAPVGQEYIIFSSKENIEEESLTI